MAKIHGSVYLIAGFFVAIFSWTINYQKFALFFYIGIIFILIGIAKLILTANKINDKNKTKMIHHPIYQRNLDHAHSQSKQYKRCYKCSNIARLHDRYCSQCGSMF